MTNTGDATATAHEAPTDETTAEETGRNANRSTTPESEGFRSFIGGNWAERDETPPSARPQAAYAAARRAKVSAEFPGQRLVIPAGEMKQRANDTEYPYRAHSAFAHLTGWGSDSEPGAVLVLEPTGEAGHEATVYFRERAGRDSEEFYANPAIGEFWIGPRPSLEHVAADLQVATRGIADFDAVVAAVDTATLVLREADPAITERVDHGRLRFAAEAALSTNASDAPFSIEVNAEHEPDADLARVLSELRLVKDEFEVAELRAAVDATERGFAEVLAELPRITSEVRGERVIEGVFATRARLDGNDVGYGSIAAAGPHATILHWTRNDGPVVPGDLVLLDAGVEMDSYYTADITRTFPVNGEFSAVQRQVYEAVLEAADAALSIVRPGIVFREIHAAAMEVIAKYTAEWGFLPVSAEESLKPENQFHRRYMVHGTSHHLGLDVHDCAQARRAMYMDGVLEPGMVFTIEPGLYFQADDLSVPEEFRGIGVRIEDDILVTADGAENLSARIPRTIAEVEAWVRGAQA
ncbi:aminopeptidase P family protein [Agromyces marinus]|uniref:Xaa-Pro aminopeptidase n=1 Tax=Agromyces marinus TaxID=1389020 RepID=A0ABN6YES7_9MICO|nr:aminopeptidase P family protein [Agromyces marinus]UIP59060.1 Xaa-Pro aminopeptidase 1 [Agromyces marinus]BDZ55957.1 Xaa-Pro aminopeptidase [Agromyces marinus]